MIVIITYGNENLEKTYMFSSDSPKPQNNNEVAQGGDCVWLKGQKKEILRKYPLWFGDQIWKIKANIL